MKALILGAGYATRLYPLTRTRPKPLLPVGGVPIIQRILDKLVEVKGLDHIYVVSNHTFVAQYYTWLNGVKSPIPVDIYDDMTRTNEDRLGAIGDIQFVIDHAKIDDELLVVAGDNLIEFKVQDFVDFSAVHGTSVALKDLGSSEHVSLYGAVTTDAEHRVTKFEEKPPRPKTSLIAIGLYGFKREHLPLMKKYLSEGYYKDAPGYFLQWLYEKVPLYGYVIGGEWFDIGDIDSYNRANEKYGDT